ncbi:MAG: hypothetical protein AAFQ95_05950 [Cyanobacteria bacterium J06621_3]
MTMRLQQKIAMGAADSVGGDSAIALRAGWHSLQALGSARERECR